jgi:hypothetical protein
MKSVDATPVVASKATDSPVVEAHGARIPLIGLRGWRGTMGVSSTMPTWD